MLVLVFEISIEVKINHVINPFNVNLMNTFDGLVVNVRNTLLEPMAPNTFYFYVNTSIAFTSDSTDM